MQHTLVVFVEDRPGALARVASVFRRRLVNIQTLAGGPSETPGTSRMTLAFEADTDVVLRLRFDLLKQQWVRRVDDVDPPARRQMRMTWMDGELVEEARATVPFLTAGLHYGVGVFEGIRCYDTPDGPAVFRLRDHLDRLDASARILGFRDLRFSAGDLVEAVKATIAANSLRACYIRPLIYLADGGMDLNIDSGRPRTGIAVWPWSGYHGHATEATGIRLSVSSYTRHHPNVMPTKAKVSGNYVNSFLAKTECARIGFDDAVMLDPQGLIAECTAENLFLVRRGRIVTPPLAAVLAGITRDTVVTLARDEGIEVEETPCPRDWLYDSDEVFATGTAAEVVAVREIDHRHIGDGRPGPITRRLQAAFADAVVGRHRRSAGWLDRVYPEAHSADEKIAAPSIASAAS